MDKYKIDSHKLVYHVARVNDWLAGKPVYPIYLEICAAGGCNHRCTFCGLDFMQYKPLFLDKDVLIKRLGELGGLGLKSIMFGGEGEPLLHQDLAEIVIGSAKSGIDPALTTNGVFLDERFVDKALPHMKWIKISLNAGTPETYSLIHGTKAEDFDTVVKNIKNAVEHKKKHGLNCVLGVQMILLPENVSEAGKLAVIAKDIGADYIVFKPYSQHPLSITERYKNINYETYREMESSLNELNSHDFNVIFRARSMNKWDEGKKDYDRCYALSFINYMDSYGNIWGCICFINDERFLIGNIYENTAHEIYGGERRKKAIEWIENNLDAHKCRVNCRMEPMNSYLWELKNPDPHVNFI